MELNTEKKEEQRRCWLQELDHQRQEATERRRREKLLQNQVSFSTDPEEVPLSWCLTGSLSADGGPGALDGSL